MTKVYVKVNVNIDEYGNITPVYIVYNDVHYNIDKILDIRRAPNAEVGGLGMRYTIRIGAHTTHLWEERGRWWVVSQE